MSIRNLYLSALLVFSISLSASLAHTSALARYIYQYDATHHSVFYSEGAYATFPERQARGARAGDERRLYRLDLATGQRTQIFQTTSGEIHDVKVSPSGAFVAFREAIFKVDVPPDEANYSERRHRDDEAAGPIITRYYYENRILRVITTDGVELMAVEKVRDYVWSPDGNAIAYVTGEYQGHYAEYKLTGTWIYDLGKQEAKKIFEGGRYLFWAAFDENLYIWDVTLHSRPVLRYTPSTAELALTNHKSIYFSPSGKYYYNPDVIAGPFDIYVTATNDSLKNSSPILSNAINLAPLLGWSPYGDSLLLEAGIVIFRDPVTGFIEEKSVKGVTWLYNVEEASATEVAAEGVITWGDTPDQLLIYSRSGKVVKKTLHELAVR